MSSEHEITNEESDVPTIGRYVDLEEQERQKFRQIEGVGQKTADVLVEAYDLFDRAVDHILGNPNGWNRKVGRKKTDAIRDALQEDGYEPPCGCEHYGDVKSSQTRSDVLSHCRTCGEVLFE